MNTKLFISLLICLLLIIHSWSGNQPLSPELKSGGQGSSVKEAVGTAQISGVGFYATTEECSDVEGYDYAVRMTGDLQGCLYAFIDEFECSPSGTYREEGREYFVGMYKGESGTFWTNYKFEAKYEGCAANGGPLGPEIFGRCQHPVEAGSGTGVFDGVTERIDMKDNVEDGNFPYRGHLRY
jgi:hypothetical protein